MAADGERTGASPGDVPTQALQLGDLPSLETSTFTWTLVAGPDEGKHFTFDSGRPQAVLVGTSAACEFRLSDPSVSRRHASLDARGNRLLVTDLGSTNGTTVDGVSVVQAYLRGGELVRLGDSVARVELDPNRRKIPLTARESFGKTLGASEAMRRLYPLCERLAASDVAVIIEGETGTGKELLAESLHEQGPRTDEPFVVFDCAAVAPDAIATVLFGAESSAGDRPAHRGAFERAERGTLLFDEIAELPLEHQPTLLGAIERGEVTRVGGTEPIGVQARILVTTRRDLDQEVQAGHFREDLFHRLAVARISLPPLRERHGDVPLLGRAFCQTLGGDPQTVPERLWARWQAYGWPGNVRELRNTVARHLVLGDLAEADAEDVAAPTATVGAPTWSALTQRGDTIARILTLDLPLSDARQRLMDEFEIRYVEHLLDTHNGNVTRAAAAAGVGRRHLQRMKAKLSQD